MDSLLSVLSSKIEQLELNKADFYLICAIGVAVYFLKFYLLYRRDIEEIRRRYDVKSRKLDVAIKNRLTKVNDED
jgi:hypothetical protein